MKTFIELTKILIHVPSNYGAPGTYEDVYENGKALVPTDGLVIMPTVRANTDDKLSGLSTYTPVSCGAVNFNVKETYEEIKKLMAESE